MSALTVRDVDPSVREWLFAREAMRQLGFAGDDLYFVVAPSGQLAEDEVVHAFDGPVIVLELRAQGKRWRWVIGATKIPLREIEGHYREACELWNAGAFDQRDWEESTARQQIVPLVQRLVLDGFRLEVSP